MIDQHKHLADRVLRPIYFLIAIDFRRRTMKSTNRHQSAANAKRRGKFTGNTPALGLGLCLALGSFTSSAQALELTSGEPSGAYFNEFCPPIAATAEENEVTLTCRTSKGTLDNLNKVAASPETFGLAQYDLFAAKLRDGGEGTFNPVRDDIAKECLFMVTKNKLMTNYGDVASSAEYLNFTLPPANSGHAGSFKFLQSIDKDGLGKASSVSHAASTEDAITTTLADENNITLLVQFPNPDSPIFKLVTENGGKFLPVISRDILAQTSGGRKIYTAEETEVTNPKWNESGKELITACTPIILFTGKTAAITDEGNRALHQKAIIALTEANAEKLRPKKDWFSTIWNSTKDASATTVETLVEASETAKKKSSPYLKKAKEVTEDAIEAAKPAYEKAKETTKEALEAAKPTLDQAKETTKSFWEKTKDWSKSVYDSASDYFNSPEKPTKTPEPAPEGE